MAIDHETEGWDTNAEWVDPVDSPTGPINPNAYDVAAGFAVKDSGQRQEFASGMKRDVTTGKIDYSLVFDGPMLKRWAEHLTKGAVKYTKRNWMKAAGQEELDRFRESAIRHFIQAMNGETDEDHFAATVFNLNGMLYVKQQMENK